MITLQQDEKLLYTFRRHPIVLLGPILAVAILAALPYVAYRLGLRDLIANIPIQGDPALLLTFIYLAWITILWLAFSAAFVDHWLDVWVVTDKRLLDFEQQGLFHRESAVTRHALVQDISVEVKGILPTLLDYGDVHVQTAGANKEFTMKNVTKPYKIKQIISDLADNAKA